MRPLFKSKYNDDSPHTLEGLEARPNNRNFVAPFIERHPQYLLHDVIPHDTLLIDHMLKTHYGHPVKRSKSACKFKAGLSDAEPPSIECFYCGHSSEISEEDSEMHKFHQRRATMTPKFNDDGQLMEWFCRHCQCLNTLDEVKLGKLKLGAKNI